MRHACDRSDGGARLTPRLILTRTPGDDLGAGELTHLERVAIDPVRARVQHAAYCALLAESGADVVTLPPLAGHPDAVFVEDGLIALPEVAVLTRPGAASRRGEVDSLEGALPRGLIVERIAAPGTIDGGDVLCVDKTIFVGRSTRTNAEGIAALAKIVAPHGYRVVPVEVGGALHLKTAVTALAPDLLLCNPRWVDTAQFEGPRTIAVDEREPFAANTLPIGSRTIVSAAHPRTEALVEAAGFKTVAVDVSELAKAEAGLTCMSVIFD